MLVEPVDCCALYNDEDIYFSRIVYLEGWTDGTLASYIGATSWLMDSTCEPQRYIRFRIDRIPRVMGFIYMQNSNIYEGDDAYVGFYNAETNSEKYLNPILGLRNSTEVAQLTPRKLTDILYRRKNKVYEAIGETREKERPRLRYRTPNIAYGGGPLPKRLTAKTRKAVWERIFGDVLIAMLSSNISYLGAIDEIAGYYAKYHEDFFVRWLNSEVVEEDRDNLQDELYRRIRDEIDGGDNMFWSWHLEESESLERLFDDL